MNNTSAFPVSEQPRASADRGVGSIVGAHERRQRLTVHQGKRRKGIIAPVVLLFGGKCSCFFFSFQAHCHRSCEVDKHVFLDGGAVARNV